MWIKEGYSIRQIAKISGHNYKKIQRIKEYWLKQEVKEQYIEYSKIRYILFDGTYFNKTKCLIVFMDALTGEIISSKYVRKENYNDVRALAEELKNKGLKPKSVTLDGLQLVIKAIKDTWEGIIVQRCLYHIYRQGTMWLRFKPKKEISIKLKTIYNSIKYIHNQMEANKFFETYDNFIKENLERINRLDNKNKVEQDIVRAISLIRHARQDMFHYLEDRNIPETTNKLEGFFSKLKQKYRSHAGLSKDNRKSYLYWFCFYENESN